MQRSICFLAIGFSASIEGLYSEQEKAQLNQSNLIYADGPANFPSETFLHYKNYGTMCVQSNLCFI